MVLFISGWVSSRRRGQRSPSGPGGTGSHHWHYYFWLRSRDVDVVNLEGLWGTMRVLELLL